MNPYDEVRLREEVIYLHSLWHQGPPHPQPPPRNPIHLPLRTLHSPIPSSSSQPPHYIPQQPLPPHFHAPPWHLHQQQQQQHTIHPPFAPAHTRSLPPVTSTAFKKRNNKKKKKKKEGTRPNPPRSPGPEWPRPAPPDPPTTGWAASKPSSAVSVVSPEEKERLAALQAQNKACQAFREFLIDSDDDDNEEDDDDDDDDGLEEFEEFFVGVFMEEHELRRYYQRHFEGGEFCCLVCGAVGKKNSGKKFKDCVGLVQHSMLILRTEKKRAHRAFGQAVCKVLGWDIDRLPTIVMKGEPLGCSLEMKPPEAEGEPKEKVDDDGINKSDDNVVSLGHDDEPVEDHAREVDQHISECSNEDDLNNVENLDEKMLDIGLQNRGGGATDEGEREKPADSDVNIIQEISGEPEKPADNSNVCQENLAK